VMRGLSGKRVSGAGMDTLGAMFLSLFGNKILSSGKLSSTPSSNMIPRLLSSGNVGGVTNRNVAGFGMDSITALFARYFGNRALTSGVMSGTPSSGRMLGLRGISSGMLGGTPSSGNMMGTPANNLVSGMALGGLTVITNAWKRMTETIASFALTAFTVISAGSKKTLLAISDMWKLMVLPMLGKGASAVASGASGLGASLLGGLALFGRWLTPLILKLASFATWLGLAVVGITAVVGIFDSISNNLNIKFGDIWASIAEGFQSFYDNIKWAGGFLVTSFSSVVDLLIMAAREWVFGWSREDAEKAFIETHNKSMAKWVPSAPKAYEGPADYFKEVIDKMVASMSPTGKMDDLSNEDRETIMRDIMTNKHNFNMVGDKYGEVIALKKAALSMEEAMTLFPELFWTTIVPATPDPEQKKEEGLPQWEEEIKIKLGEIAQAFTLGSAEAWNAIIPKYYVEEKTLKLQEKQLKLSEDLVKSSQEVASNTARLTNGASVLEARV